MVVVSLPQQHRLQALAAADLSTLWSLDLEEPGVMALDGDTLVVATRDDLTWLAWQADDLPQVVGSTTLGAVPHDLDLGSAGAAAALGGLGVAWITPGAGAPADDPVPLPAATYSVSVDGTRLWATAWDELALLDVASGRPELVGTEPLVSLGTAVLAGQDRAVVTDWSALTTVQARAVGPSPELVLDRTVQRPADGTEPLVVPVQNAGAATLTLSVASTPAWQVAPSPLTVRPGETASLTLTPTEGAADVELAWTSTDLDEPTGTLSVTTSETGLGTVHPELVLPGFTWPDTALAVHDLAELRGQVVALAYFNVW